MPLEASRGVAASKYKYNKKMVPSFVFLKKVRGLLNVCLFIKTIMVSRQIYEVRFIIRREGADIGL